MLAAEQETTITYDNEDKLVRIFSARQADQGKLKRAGITPASSNSFGAFYTVPLAQFKWRVVPRGHLKKILPSDHPFRGGSRGRRGTPDAPLL